MWFNPTKGDLCLYTYEGLNYTWKKINGLEESSSGAFKRKLYSEIHKEIPEGNIDGYNFVFELSKLPIKNSEQVFLNGLLQRSGENSDYTISDNIIYFIEPPYEGSTISCSYSYEDIIEIKNEIPNKILYLENTFEIENIPELGSEYVFLNGLLQKSGSDYIIEENILTFFNEISPYLWTLDNIYRWGSSGGDSHVAMHTNEIL